MRRALFWAFFGLVLPLGVVVLLIFGTTGTIFKKQLHVALETASRHLLDRVQTHLDSKLIRARDFTSDGLLLQALDEFSKGQSNGPLVTQAREHFTRTKLPLDRECLGIELVDSSSRVVFAVGASPTNELAASVKLETFRERAGFGLITAVDGKPAYPVVAPVFNQPGGGPAGFLIFHLAVAPLDKFLQADANDRQHLARVFSNTPESHRVYIADQDRNIIVGAPGLIGRKADARLVEHALRRRSAYVGEQAEAGDKEQLEYAFLLNGPGWVMVASLPRAEVFAHLTRWQGVIFIFVLLVGALVMLIATLGAMRVVQPMLEVARTAEAITEGRADHRLNPRSRNDESMRVARSFNQMVDKLLAATREVSRSEAKFRTLVEQSLTGIYVIQDERFVYANPRMAEILGSTIEGVTSGPLYKFIAPESRGAVADNIRKRISGEVPSIHYELRMVREDGAEIDVEAHGTRTEYGGRPAILGTLVDVSERRRAAATLARERNLLRTMIDHLPLFIFVKDTAGRYLLSNEAHNRLLSVAQESELLGKTVFDFLPAQKAREYDLDDQKVIKTGQLIIEREELHQAVGEHRWYATTKVPVRDGEGRITSLVGIKHDITDRKRADAALRQSELRFRHLAELGRELNKAASIHEGAAIVVECADRMMRWDSCCLDLYDTANNRVHTVLARDTIEGVRKDVTSAVDSAEPSPLVAPVTKGKPLLILRKPGELAQPGLCPFGDKTRRSASLMYVPIRESQHVIGILTIQSYVVDAYDESDLETLQALADYCAGAFERISAEDGLRRLNQELEQRVAQRTMELENVNRELESFSYSVSHDLRAPLRAVAGFSQALIDQYTGKIDDMGRDYLQRVRAAADRMGLLIDDLLNLSRVTRQEMHLRPVDLSATVVAVAAELQQSQPGRTVEWAVTPGVTVTGDARLLRVVLDNLVGNAWKFTSKIPAARIEFGQQTKDTGKVVCYVRDNGAGFDMKYAEKLFGAFQRLHAMSDFPGTGIGLATAQRIIRRHGGRIWAEGSVGGGATFYFELNHQTTNKELA